MNRSHGKALTAFVVNKYPHMLAKCCCPGYIEIQNFVNANVLDFEYHLARWCALWLSEVLHWVKADVGKERESVLERLYERRDYKLYGWQLATFWGGGCIVQRINGACRKYQCHLLKVSKWILILKPS